MRFLLPPLVLSLASLAAAQRTFIVDTNGRGDCTDIQTCVNLASGGDRVLVLETELDDAVPQLLGPLLDRLLAQGALDAFFTPVQMKKGRPGVLVTVIAEASGREALEELLFRETTTLGVRRQECDRTVLERETLAVETDYGPIRVKIGHRGGTTYNAWPEFDDCQRAAAEKGVAVKEVLAAALAAWRAGAQGKR